MRTLTRPMFNMGGPIKQGIMNGIREPHQAGQIVGRMLPYAAKAFQKVTGLFKRKAPSYGEWLKNRIATGQTGTQGPGLIKSWFQTAPAGKYLAGSPEGRLLSGGAGWAGAAGQKIGSVVKGAAKSPLTVGAGGYGAYRGIKGLLGGDDAANVVTGDMIGAGPLHGVKEKKVKTKEAAAAFAKSQREDRVNKYLDMMGYDRSKKMAIADALIDASKIVGERGTLEAKNITKELINPIIQATSKRLDKPEQIREAVGLMTMKAAIEKDISKEKDALASELTRARIDVQKATLAQDSIAGDIKAHYLKHNKLPKGESLAQLARLRDIEVTGVSNTTEVDKWMKKNNKNEVEYLTAVIEKTQLEPGIYVVSDRILIIDANNTVKELI